jgi:hypothetical protein
MRLSEILLEMLKAYEQRNKLQAYELRKTLIYNLMTHGYAEDEVKEFVNKLQRVLYEHVRCSETLALLREALENILDIPREEV